MPSTNKNNKRRRSDLNHSDIKILARTERMQASVRLGVCLLFMAGCIAFMVAAMPDYRELERKKSELALVQANEKKAMEDLDAKQRELTAVHSDPEYLEIIARDRLNYYEPGEHIFRMNREK